MTVAAEAVIRVEGLAARFDGRTVFGIKLARKVGRTTEERTFYFDAETSLLAKSELNARLAAIVESSRDAIIGKTLDGQLSPARSVGAVGGLEAAVEGMRAMMDGRFAGKILIFPQVRGLPLTGIEELANTQPEIAAKLGPSGEWTAAAEAALLEKYWQR